MAAQLLWVNFELAGEVSDEEMTEFAEGIAEFPGLRWKIWPFNEERNEEGGIYLFEDEHSVERYRNSEYVETFRNDDRYRNVEIKQFDIRAGLSEITHANDVISGEAVPE
ncbi:hypothetical protein C448_05723 [Halococcus morrhuae DSM 1307]|uniref:Monooxygenase n=1 Tax=Halococcus morrhuae DSM 1307 TaxID=931277 RepID=M0MMG5_HALMO|nr:YdhR family protein [Halococcus morrhuae]EMA46866.1 hypothetical protein C448_05723 [Halococcus morrhuae DSM 1307]